RSAELYPFRLCDGPLGRPQPAGSAARPRRASNRRTLSLQLAEGPGDSARLSNIQVVPDQRTEPLSSVVNSKAKQHESRCIDRNHSFVRQGPEAQLFQRGAPTD